MTKNEVFAILDQLYLQARMQYGDAIKSKWFHDGDGCPGCGRKVTAMKFKGQNAMSLNAYIYREHGVLIAYLLCGKCGRKIIRDAEADPLASTTALHSEIEKNLKAAFLKNLGH
jgi:hypothetical protein